MAFKHSIIFKFHGKDVVIDNSYIRVAQIVGNKDLIKAVVEINEPYVGDDSTAKHGQVIEVQSYTFKPNLEGENFLTQAYAHLKSLNKFSGAVDC